MGQPEFVPALERDRVQVTGHLPVPGAWAADRPGDVKDSGGQPRGPLLGSAGPDQGYALRLASLLRDRLTLAPGEAIDDAIAGCVEVAMKRASLFGRAPVMPDVEIAFTLWGFLGDAPEPELVAFRQAMFAGAAHHYPERRAIVDHVPEDTLRLTLPEVQARVRTGWRALLTAA
jgi:hypothetical protein